MLDIATDPSVERLRRHAEELFGRRGLHPDLSTPAGDAGPDRLREAVADGFTDALLMPATGWQQANADAVLAAFAADDGWGSPYVAVDGLSPVDRPDRPYVLLLRPDARTDDDLRGLTAPALRKALAGGTCLTVLEYAVVQRALYERDGDHRFDDYGAERSGWMWLADSTDGTRTAMGYWNGGKGRVEVTACKAGSKNPRKGARRTRVVPLT